MKAPSLLGLDLMDTVVADPIFTAIPQLIGCPIQELFDQILDPQAWIAFETGHLDEAEYLNRMLRVDCMSEVPPPQILMQTLHGGYHFIEGMEQLLSDLVQNGVSIWALSNYSAWSEVIRHKLDLDRFFEGYVISYQTGFRKPDARAYLSLCEQATVPAGRCLFVDDRQKNVDGARIAGMQGLLFETAAKLRAELEAIGLLGAT